MRTTAQICLDVLRPPPGFSLAHVSLAPLTPAAIRERAPAVVGKGETLDFRTLVPEAGGLFDYKLFGPGTVIDAPQLGDDEPVKPRRTRFARITLAEPITHPLVLAYAPRAVADGESWMLHELPVLPPDLRPLERLDDDRWKTSPINDLYRRIIQRNARWARVIEQQAPPPVIEGERRDLVALLLALFENEDRPEPVVDGQARPLQSLRGMCGGQAGLFTALGDLDRHPVGDAPLPARLDRAEAVLYALGFALVRGGV